MRVARSELTKLLSHLSFQGSAWTGFPYRLTASSCLRARPTGRSRRRSAEQLGIPLCKVTCNRFADGEIFVRIDENVRGNDVFIVQPTNPPAENIMELLLLIDAARRASAARITVRDAVLRLLAAGPQGPAARGHRRQAGGEHDR